MKLLCTASLVITRSLVEDDSGHIQELNMDTLGNFYFWDEPLEGKTQEDIQARYRALASDPKAWDKDSAQEFAGMKMINGENWRTGKPAQA
jgi:hypothetical protein